MSESAGRGENKIHSSGALRSRLPDDAPNRWVDPACRYCKPGSPCLTHDRRPRTLAQNRVIFGPSFGYEPTEVDHEEAAFPWAT
jgi:hypothetical protein